MMGGGSQKCENVSMFQTKRRSKDHLKLDGRRPRPPPFSEALMFKNPFLYLISSWTELSPCLNTPPHTHSEFLNRPVSYFKP